MKTKMTPEERKARLKERQEGEREQRRRWPGFALSDRGNDSWGQIWLQTGNPSLVIRMRKHGKWEEESDCPGVERRILKPSLEQTLDMIRALAVRYNAIVEDMNKTAAGIVIPEIRIVPQVAQIDSDVNSGTLAQ